MSLYRLDASIRVEGSHSRAIADIVEQEWRNAHPGEPVIRRHIGVDPIPATTWATAVFAGRTPEESRTDEQQAALALAAAVAITRRRPPEAGARSLAGTRSSADGCARRTTSDPGFVTSDQWKCAPRRATLG